MILKQKSLIVALISGFIVAVVLVLTLIGYVGYLEIKHEKFRRTYYHLLHKALAKSYIKHVEVTDLRARTESAGALKGHPIVEGDVVNKGSRAISDMLLKVKFLDRNGAAIYEVIFRPQDPALGSAGLSEINIPYINPVARAEIRPGMSLPFKKIMNDLPDEISGELEKTRSFRPPYSAPENLGYKIISLELQDNDRP